MTKNLRPLIIALFTALVAVSLGFGVRLHVVAAERIQVKEDFQQVNSFTMGLLSVDIWKTAIQGIVTKKIDDFQLSPAQEKILRHQAAQVLKALIRQAEVITQKQQGLITIAVSKSLIGTARKNVPAYARTVIDEVKKPVNFLKLKALAREQFDAYVAMTRGSVQDAVLLRTLLAKYGAVDVAGFNAAAALRIKTLDAESRRCVGVLMGALALFILALGALWGRTELRRLLLGASTAFALVLLIIGLSVPMIEIDARLTSVDFQLMGNAVHFNDQVLYYRSKSLLQVVSTLLTSRKLDSIGVGLLLLCFSVLFPAAKIACTALLLGRRGAAQGDLVRFFALRSGKWSMADVNVVAIFMAFIGFRGILNSQLANLAVKSNVVESITTNATSLQPGFTLFTVFVLFSLILSEFLKRTLSGTPQPRPVIRPSVGSI